MCIRDSYNGSTFSSIYSSWAAFYVYNSKVLTVTGADTETYRSQLKESHSPPQKDEYTTSRAMIDKNTIVLFSSDNGPWLRFEKHGGSAGPLRAGKGTTFEGGQRVPTIFWGPGIVKKGIVNEMGSTLDIINTFSSLANIDMPKDRKMDGYDLSKVLINMERRCM